MVRSLWRAAALAVLLGAAGFACAQAGGEAPPVPDAPLTIQQAMMRWTRSGDRSFTAPNGDTIHRNVDLTLAHPTFFEAGGHEVPPGIADGREVVFFLTESIHYGDLPVDPPRFQLYVDELGPFDAAEALLINPDPHHRTHRLAFRAPDGAPATLVDPDTVQVVLSAVGGTRPLVLAWDLHAAYDGPTPLNLASAEVVRVSVTPYGFVPGVLEFAVGRPVIVVFDNPTDHEHHFHAEYLPIGDSLRWLVVPDGRELTDDALRAAAQFTTHICESEFGYCPTGAWVHLHANPGGQDAIAFVPRTPGIFGVSCPLHPDVAGNIVVRIERHTH
jgi:hypothetical protein